MKLPQDEAHIWVVTDVVTQLDLATYESVLDQTETLRASRFRFPADRHRFVVGHGLLRAILSLYGYGQPMSLRIARRCALCGGEDHGKPYLLTPTGEPAGARFSISYSDQLIALAFCDGKRIGVDVEKFDPHLDWQEIANHVFSPAELRSIAGLNNDNSARRAFYKIWTRKEAVAKASGQAVSQLAELDTCAWRDVEDGLFEVPFTHPEPGWVGKDLDLTDTHVAAVAVEGRVRAYKCFKTSPQEGVEFRLPVNSSAGQGLVARELARQSVG